MANPPSAGPRARARLNPALFNDTASGSCWRGTSSGMMACHAGLFIAVPTLRRQVRTSNTHGEMMLKKVSRLRSATAPSIQACQNSKRRRRSKMSAVAPASSPRIKTGRLAAVCIRAIRSGDGVSKVISQVPAVSCIQPPRFEIVEAIHKLRKSEDRSGSKPDERRSAVESSSGMGGGLGVGERGMRMFRNKLPNDTGVETHFCPHGHVLKSPLVRGRGSMLAEG